MSKPATKTETQLTLGDEDENILDAAKQEARFDRLMKFREGAYFIQDDVIPLATEYLAHAAAWTKVWIKFIDGKRVGYKPYRVALKEQPPPREELDDLDESSWPKRDGKPNDPWVFQYLLPLENLETGEVVIFTTSTVGGRIGVSELAGAYAHQKIAKRKADQPSGQPIIRLSWKEMPTKYGTKRPRPHFEIVGWDETEASRAGIPEETLTENTSANDDDMDDEIPF